MSKTFVYKSTNAKTTSRPRGRGSNTGTVINTGRGRAPTNSSPVRHPAPRSTATNMRGTGRSRPPMSYATPRGGRGQGGMSGQVNSPYGRNVGYAGQHNAGSQEDDTGLQEPQASGQSLQDRTEQRGSYSVTRPKEEKRNAVKEQARKGLESYERHRESKKITHVSYVGTVGGGETDQAVTRQKQQHDLSRAQFNSRQRAEQYRAQEKAREEAEYAKKKQAQRKKSEANERSEESRQNSLREQHEGSRQAWLDRLDRGTQEAKSKKILSTTAARTYCPVPEVLDDDDEEEDVEDEGFGAVTDGATLYSPEGAAQYSPGGATYSADDVSPNLSHLHEDSTPLDELISIFPSYNPDVLNRILMDCNGDVSEARKLLLS